MRFSLGIGLTNACNLACAHCYRNTGTDALGKEQVYRAVEAVDTRSVNFGTGENGLHPDFAEIVENLADRGIEVTMTTNGHSAEVLADDVLKRFRDVEFSIDFPSREAHDQARGAGNWDLIATQMARCARLGVSTTIIAVMMATNVELMADLLALAGERDAFLRVNVYQAVRRDMFSLGYAEFWGGFRSLLAHGDLLTCGEPVVRAALQIPRTEGAGCGVETLRITPRGAVVPCVYGKDDALALDDLAARGASVVDSPIFTSLRVLPAACAGCAQKDTCGGGCPSRRALRGSLDQKDQYCPFLGGEVLEAAQHDLGRALPKAASACTTIFRARKHDPRSAA